MKENLMLSWDALTEETQWNDDPSKGLYVVYELSVPAQLDSVEYHQRLYTNFKVHIVTGFEDFMH